MPLSFRRYTAAALMTAAFAGAQLRPAQVFILIGPPGSGKSVQAELLSKSHKVPALSMATLLKRETGKKTRLGKALASSLASGELVSDDAANDVMTASLLRTDVASGFILDGYPASEKQAKALDEFLSENGFPKPIVVILEAPDSVLRERMKGRGRADDGRENIERRLREYRELGAFTEKWYGPENTVRVDGAGSVPIVAGAIAQQIEAVRSKKALTVRSPDVEGLKVRPPETPAP